jgi:accessory Sec system S-layer assembly protein
MALFKRKTKTAPVIESEQLNELVENNSGVEENEGSELVKTALSFHPDWELTNQEKYVYMYKHEQLPLLKENQISISGIKKIDFDEGFVVIAFLRNTLAKAIRLEEVGILILDETGEAAARKTFELDGLGELPAMSCRPWRFLFYNEDKLKENLPDSDWSIAFEVSNNNSQHSLDLEDTWKAQLPDHQIKQLEELVAKMPALSPNEISFTGIEARLLDDARLSVSLFIRNGYNKDIQLQKIPLIVEDANGTKVAQGSFTLESFSVKANTSKPWTFIFPETLVLEKNPDLSTWRVYPPQ